MTFDTLTLDLLEEALLSYLYDRKNFPANVKVAAERFKLVEKIYDELETLRTHPN